MKSIKNKFSIITPCFNAEKFIEETIESVIRQTVCIANSIELEYIIIDGKSTDNTVDVIERTIRKYDGLKKSITLISEEDKGMYDALVKGLKLITGNICGYINADDYYYKTAFDVVNESMNLDPKIKWVTGYSVHYNEYSAITNINMPYLYRNGFIKKGLYGTKLPFIQQESTFWKAELNSFIDFNELVNYKYAGDYYLWNKFSDKAKLYIIQSVLGGFRVRKGQLSADKFSYMEEMKNISNCRGGGIWKMFFDKIIFALMSDKAKRFLNDEIIYFDIDKGKWNMRKN